MTWEKTSYKEYFAKISEKFQKETADYLAFMDSRHKIATIDYIAALEHENKMLKSRIEHLEKEAKNDKPH